jgi:hypothetical protein
MHRDDVMQHQFTPSLIGACNRCTPFTHAVNNPNKDMAYTNEPIRLQADVSGCAASDVTVTNTSGGGTVVSQVEVLEGTSTKIAVWIVENIAPGEVHTFSVSCSPSGSAKHVDPSTVAGPTAKLQGYTYVLSNSVTKVVVSAAPAGGLGQGADPPPPFFGMSVTGPSGQTVGGSSWNTSLSLTSFTSTIDAR